MRIQIVDAVLTPQPFVRVGDEERRAEYAAIDRLFQICGIGFGTNHQAAVGKSRIKPGLLKTGLHDGIVGDVLLVGPNGRANPVKKQTDITATGLLSRDQRVGCGRTVGGPVLATAFEILNSKEQYESCIEGIEAAIRNDQGQPWMYDLLAVFMQVAGRPRRQIDDAHGRRRLARRP